jgi:hypothetical protein
MSFDRLLTLALCLMLVGTSLMLFTPPAEAQAPVSVSLEPATAAVPAGDVVQLDIVVDPGGREVDGVQVRVQYDPGSIQPVGPSGQAGTDLAAGSTLDFVLVNRVNSAESTIDYAAGKLLPPFPSERFVLGTARFLAVAPTTADGTTVGFALATGGQQPQVTVTFAGNRLPSNVGSAQVTIEGEGPVSSPAPAPPTATATAVQVQATSPSVSGGTTPGGPSSQAIPTPLSTDEPTVNICHATGTFDNPYPYQLLAVPTSAVQTLLVERRDVFPSSDGSCPTAPGQTSPARPGGQTPGTSEPGSDLTSVVILVVLVLLGVGGAIWWSRRSSGPGPGARP